MAFGSSWREKSEVLIFHVQSLLNKLFYLQWYPNLLDVYPISIIRQIRENKIEESEQQNSLIKISSEGKISLKRLNMVRITGKIKDPILVTQ